MPALAGRARGVGPYGASNFPWILIDRAFNMIKVAEPVMGGGSREVPKAQQVPGEFIVLGTSFPQNGAPRGRMEGGYTLTTGCPKELWERWLADNKDTPMVKNGLIFAHDSESCAAWLALERAGSAGIGRREFSLLLTERLLRFVRQTGD